MQLVWAAVWAGKRGGRPASIRSKCNSCCALWAVLVLCLRAAAAVLRRAQQRVLARWRGAPYRRNFATDFNVRDWRHWRGARRPDPNGVE